MPSGAGEPLKITSKNKGSYLCLRIIARRRVRASPQIFQKYSN
jgi:hypothetical protein